MLQQYSPCHALAAVSGAIPTSLHTNLDTPQLPLSSRRHKCRGLSLGRTQQRAEEAGRREYRSVVYVEQPLECQADGDGRGAEQNHEHRGRRADLPYTRKDPVSHSMQAGTSPPLPEGGGAKERVVGMKMGGASISAEEQAQCCTSRPASQPKKLPQLVSTRGRICPKPYEREPTV